MFVCLDSSSTGEEENQANPLSKCKWRLLCAPRCRTRGKNEPVPSFNRRRRRCLLARRRRRLQPSGNLSPSLFPFVEMKVTTKRKKREFNDDNKMFFAGVRYRLLLFIHLRHRLLPLASVSSACLLVLVFATYCLISPPGILHNPQLRHYVSVCFPLPPLHLFSFYKYMDMYLVYSYISTNTMM